MPGAAGAAPDDVCGGLEVKRLNSFGELWRVPWKLGEGHARCRLLRGWARPWKRRGGHRPKPWGTSSPGKRGRTKLRWKNQALLAERCAGMLQALFCSWDQQWDQQWDQGETVGLREEWRNSRNLLVLGTSDKSN